jgi:hypothetical protein
MYAYRNIFKNTRSIKPGIPSIPIVNIDPGLIPNVNPNKFPMKLKSKSASVPIAQLISTFMNFFSGDASTPKKIIPTIKINMYATNV